MNSAEKSNSTIAYGDSRAGTRIERAANPSGGSRTETASGGNVFVRLAASPAEM